MYEPKSGIAGGWGCQKHFMLVVVQCPGAESQAELRGRCISINGASLLSSYIEPIIKSKLYLFAEAKIIFDRSCVPSIGVIAQKRV